MPIREKRIYSGKFLEVEVYPITKFEKRQKRKTKQKLSLPKQKNANEKNAKKHCKRLVHGNFTEEDIVWHLTYDEKNLPKSFEEAERDRRNVFGKVKRYRKKNGLSPLKYLAVIEYKEATDDNRTKTRIHHHIIISGMDRDKLESFWTKGRSNADRLKEDEFGFEALVQYIMKDPQGKKRWSQSRNLIQPIVKVNDNKYNYTKLRELSRNQGNRADFEKLYPGYTFTDYKVDVNEINAGTYLYIKFRKILS